MEDIKGKKARVSTLASSAKHQLVTAQKTLYELDTAMLTAFYDELGERKWDDEKATYTRVLNPEERRLVSDMQLVFSRCRETLDKVVESYATHLDDICEKPLTFNTPEEEAKLATVMQTKEEYKAVRTEYSDTTIDIEAELSTGSSPSSSLQGRLDEAKRSYEAMSDRLCNDALQYERVYRDELAQRVSAHFTAENHLLRGVASAMKNFLPYSQGLTLNWQDMRSTRRANLAAAKDRRFGRDDDGYSDGDLADRLPSPGPKDKRDSTEEDAPGSPSLSSLSAEVQRRGSNAASAISSASKSAQKSIQGMVTSYGTKAAAKSAKSSLS